MSRTTQLLVLAWLAPLASAGEPFVDLAFSPACERARAEQRLVVVDFFAAWSAAARRLVEDTWPDPSVQRWIDAHAIALQLDVDDPDAAELVARYRVHSPPTVLFLHPDGRERGRLNGFVEPARLVAEANGFLAAIERLRALEAEFAATDGTSPRLRQRLAGELLDDGRYADALEHYLWCFDHGVAHDRGYATVRQNELAGRIARLGVLHPPALAALRTRRDVARDVLSGEAPTRAAAADLTRINELLLDTPHTLATFDALAGAGRRLLAPHVLDDLARQKRWDDILTAAGDPLETIGRAMQRVDGQIARLLELDPSSTAASSFRGPVLREASAYFAALLGSGRRADAARLSERLGAWGAARAAALALADGAAAADAWDEVALHARRGLAAKGNSADERARLETLARRAREHARR